MKKFILLSSFILAATHIFCQNVGIGTPTPNASAKLDVTSSNSGFLPPRMTSAQREAITNPSPGLMIFNTTTQNIEFYTNYGWIPLKKVIPFANKLLGGSNNESFYRSSMQRTTDGGCILVGSSTSSANGDVSGINHGTPDVWVVKLDAAGNITWDKLLGGTQLDYGNSVQQTSDGGYIIAGYSNSSASGDVTAINHGLYDCWIIKLDASGNISWNKLLGGSLPENAYSVLQTTDGGYIVAGSSNSSASGDVTAINHGGNDYWVIKLDASGNISWNKLLGGPGDEEAHSISQTADGGYIIGGYSNSSASGDVTGTNHGISDYWVVKLDASGNISWNKLLGGSGFEEAMKIIQTSDGNYIIAGYSSSSANGDVTGTNHGAVDDWVIKLDPSGNIIWNKLLGGSSNEYPYNILQTSDGGYIIVGISNSSANGNVTAINHGSYDYWVLKLDASGNISWNKLLGGPGDENAYSVYQTPDGGYVIAGTSNSSVSGDVTGVNHGNNDWWIIRLDANGNIL